MEKAERPVLPEDNLAVASEQLSGTVGLEPGVLVHFYA